MGHIRYRTYEIELSPKLLEGLFEYVRKNPNEDCKYIIHNLIDLSRCDDTLTMDEYEMIITKPAQ